MKCKNVRQFVRPGISFPCANSETVVQVLPLAHGGALLFFLSYGSKVKGRMRTLSENRFQDLSPIAISWQGAGGVFINNNSSCRCIFCHVRLSFGYC